MKAIVIFTVNDSPGKIHVYPKTFFANIRKFKKYYSDALFVLRYAEV